MKLSVVIPVWNNCEVVRTCFQSLRAAIQSFEGSVQVIVVDDASTDGAQNLVAQEFSEFEQLRNESNQGFAVSSNRGMAAAEGELLLLLNSDTEMTGAAMRELVGLLEAHPDWAGVAPRLVDDEGQTQQSCMDWPRLSTAFYFGTPMERWRPASSELRRYFLRDFDHESPRHDVQPPASCWLLRRSVWNSVGPFDETLELFFNDVDWALRLKDMDGTLHYRPEVSLKHLGGASTAQRKDFVLRWQTDRLRYYRKHHGRFGGLFVKACVSWTFIDWWGRRIGLDATAESREESTQVRRAFTEFLLSA